MNRLVRRQRAALALFIAMTVSGIGVALADPQGEQPGVTVDVSPDNGQNLPTPANVTVTGAGFASNGVGVSGIIVQTAELPNGTSAVSNTLNTFTSNSQGTFSSTVTVSRTFADAGSGTVVDCNAPDVQCFVQATSTTGNFNAAHTISFAGDITPTTSSTTTLPPTTTSSTTTLPPTTTSSTTTLPPTTTSSTTTLPPTTTSSTTTLPPTTTSSTTTLPPTTTSSTTTLPPTTTSSTTTLPATTTTIGGPTTTLGPAGCAALRQARINFNAQIDAARAAVIAANLPAAQQAATLAQLEAIRAQGNAQIDARLVGCPAP